MDNQLQNLKDEVIRLRAEETKAHEAALDCRKIAEATPEYQEWEKRNTEYHEVSNNLEAAEETLRMAALIQFTTDGNKNPLAGVAIKIFETISYDAAKAAEWCKANAPYLLKLDAKAFEKARPKGAPITMKQERRCQLAGKLE